ncbi:hypothetical protein HID58_089402 [Brassica napus]|uniref:SAP domain-containing protein n=1 Tax=Brassica napus TaxID=3708 RepID=A0ABQ7XZ20_BRANA|nr:hypothetical protein HID58_089396 [Brassica napus]KAH0861141.1 hypothetical protein HID58_089402 [Brassica napus]
MKTILKIRAKYGLPLDGKKIAEVQKGFEGDSKNREHAAASSGNPHHQWLSVIERLYSHFLSTNTSLSLLSRIVPNLFTAPKDSSRRPTGKRRGKGGDKDADVVAVPEKDKVTSADEMLKAFCVKFVRLNGILFTRTSLETFSDVLGSTSSSLRDLIWSSLTEDMIFCVDNSKKDKGGEVSDVSKTVNGKLATVVAEDGHITGGYSSSPGVYVAGIYGPLVLNVLPKGLELYSHDRSLFPSLNDPVDAEFSLGSDVLL